MAHLVGFKSTNHPQQVAQACVDDRALPLTDFAQLQKRFRFTVDVAASVENTKLRRFYTIKENGLFQSWKGERVYCNPPYSNIKPWIEKSWSEAEAELIVCLLPNNRAEQKWWQEWVEPYRDRGLGLTVEFLPNRIRFMRPDKPVMRNDRPPFGCCLLIWSGSWERKQQATLFDG